MCGWRQGLNTTWMSRHSFPWEIRFVCERKSEQDGNTILITVMRRSEKLSVLLTERECSDRSLVLTQTLVHTQMHISNSTAKITHTALFSSVSWCQSLVSCSPVLLYLNRVNIFCVPRQSPGLSSSISATSCSDVLFAFNRLAFVHCFIWCISQIGLVSSASYTHQHLCDAHASEIFYLLLSMWIRGILKMYIPHNVMKFHPVHYLGCCYGSLAIL